MLLSEERLKELMVGGLNGSAADHAALLRSLAPLLRSFYRRRARTGDDDVEDLVQETLIAVHTRRATYDRSRAFTGWLFAIARYKMIDHFRRRRHECPMESMDEFLTADDFEEASIAQMDVQTLLDGLPAKQANAIRETRIEGLSVAETATRAGIGQSDVKVSIHRGLKALAARIRGESP